MPNISKEGKKLIQLWVAEETWNELRLVSDSVEEPITTWIRRAIYAALRRWEKPEVKKSNWPKCSICNKKHDENDHYRVDP